MTMDQTLTAYREAGPGEPASPLKIQIMLACYVSPNPQSIVVWSTWGSPAAKDIRNQLFDDGLIDEHERPTPRGNAWVEFLCATPLPVQSGWVRP